MGIVSRLVDTVVGRRYRLGARIGAGSMGTVFEATDLRTSRGVAVKVVHSQLADDEEVAERFRREARAANAVQSPYILTVFDDGRDEALGVYLVAERLLGEDLGARLKRLGRLDPVEATTIAIHAARGLHRAHAAKIIHRDLKPANLFLTRDAAGAPLTKVLDFGIARLGDPSGAGTEGWAAITGVGVAVGTPQYMSPEQAAALDTVDARTDVWALCSILYEMLAGRSAFPDQGSAADVMLRIVRDRPAPLRSVAPWVPSALADVVHAGLTRPRRERMADCAVMEERLAEAIPDAVAAATGSRTRSAAPTAPTAPTR
jgi:serine/threonine protein kinase